MATFITSKLTGETINIYVETSTGYWKYNHNGTDSIVFGNGIQTITITNANGEFTIIPCLSDGTVSGDITQLDLQGNQLISFDGTDLTSLTGLNLNNNQLTSFNGTGLSGLTGLDLQANQLAEFSGTGLTSLTALFLNGNQLTLFDGTGLSSLTELDLSANFLTSFDGTGLSGLTGLSLSDNQLTSFNGTGLSGLTGLVLDGNLLTGLDISSLESLINLIMNEKAGGNPLSASANDSILNQFVTNGLENGAFTTIGGRTAAGTGDYDTLISRGWTIEGADLVSAVRKLRVKGVGQLNP
jgi:Leucine-rich repeat (LRR) protein